MCPQPMVTCGDAETSGIIIENGEDSGLEVERSPDGLDQSVKRDEDNEGDVKPVDVLVPVFPRHGYLGDVLQIWVVGL